MEIYNEDCITGAVKHFADESIDLIVTDPPFGIDETKFAGMYNRDNSKLL